MAAPSQFFDPFYTHLAQGGAGDGLNSEQPGKNLELPVCGQGTIAVRANANDLLHIKIHTSLLGATTFNLLLGPSDWDIYYEGPEGRLSLKPYALINKSEKDCWLSVSKEPTIYWLSIDKNNGMLRYGKWYTNTSMILVQVSLKHLDPDPAGKSMVWNNPQRDAFIEKLKGVTVMANKETLTWRDVQIQPLPVVVDLSPFVVSADSVTLEDLEDGKVTVSSNLPVACQQLYANVTGKMIVLDDDSFPEFSQAIQLSCTTKGSWAYETLEAKSGEFGKKNPEQTYLRITLGYNGGNSPGVPYVMEIWPIGHYSPIHDHGDACAVIKVLHGEINATYFNKLTKEDQYEIGTAILCRNQVTWLGEENYQIHQLHNKSDDVCVTIQCYAYSSDETNHEDVFNYLDADGNEKPWPPTSDCSFIDFKRIMQKEWKERKN